MDRVTDHVSSSGPLPSVIIHFVKRFHEKLTLHFTMMTNFESTVIKRKEH